MQNTILEYAAPENTAFAHLVLRSILPLKDQYVQVLNPGILQEVLP